MTPAARGTLRLMQGQLAGAQTHLGEANVRLRALEGSLDDVASGVIPSEGMSVEMAHLVASHLQAEIQALAVINAQLAMALALSRALES